MHTYSAFHECFVVMDLFESRTSSDLDTTTCIAHRNALHPFHDSWFRIGGDGMDFEEPVTEVKLRPKTTH